MVANDPLARGRLGWRADAEQVAQEAVAAVHQPGQDHCGYRHNQRESGEILPSNQCGSGQPYTLHSAWLAFRYSSDGFSHRGRKQKPENSHNCNDDKSGNQRDRQSLIFWVSFPGVE